MTQTVNKTRRGLIAGGTFAALAAAAGASHAAGADKTSFDKIYDVIVVGSGFAGLAAALEARLKGAEVLLIEKMPVFGGNSAINGGAFAVAGSPLQEKEGIKDSPERMLADMIRSGRGLSHVDLLKMIVEGTRPAFDFTLEHGVQYKNFVQHFGGHSVPRIMQTVESTAAASRARSPTAAASTASTCTSTPRWRNSSATPKAASSASRSANATSSRRRSPACFRPTPRARA